MIHLDDKKLPIKIIEKPTSSESNLVIPGLYFYDNTAVEKAKSIKFSTRGELEITDVNLTYLKLKKLKVEILGRGITWVDAGTFESMLEASMLVSSIQKRQGSLICSPEEIAFQNNWISKIELKLDQQLDQKLYQKLYPKLHLKLYPKLYPKVHPTLYSKLYLKLHPKLYPFVHLVLTSILGALCLQNHLQNVVKIN